MPEAPEMTYDLAVIGGGIAGCGVARDASLRGLSVAVFEKNTVGSGTSSKSSKLIHGGIRYLELAWASLLRADLPGAWKNFHFVLSSLRETRILSRTAPGIIRPIRLFVPIYRGRSRRPFSVYFGTFLYEALSRLAGNPSKPRVFRGAAAALAAVPLLDPQGLAGAVEIDDYTTDDLRLVQAVADSAKRNGAVFFEHTPVRNWKWDAKRRLFEIHVGAGSPRPGLGAETAPLQLFHAKTVLNASGPWIDKTRAQNGPVTERYVAPVGGSHIELAAFLGRSAILEARDGRVFFVIERDGRARVGTTEWPCDDPDKGAKVPETDIAYLLESLGRYFPSKKWEASDVLSSDAGVRPLAVDKSAGSATHVSREHALRTDGEGAFHLIGVKLTDHRRAAEKAVDRVLRALGKNGPRSQTAVTPLPSPRPE